MSIHTIAKLQRHNTLTNLIGRLVLLVGDEARAYDTLLVEIDRQVTLYEERPGLTLVD